jgi:hypothetical protein
MCCCVQRIIFLPNTYWVMVDLGSATRNAFLCEAQYLLQNTYWVMVYLHITTIKELMCALFVFSDILGQGLHWQCEQVCAAQYLLPNTYSPTDPNG